VGSIAWEIQLGSFSLGAPGQELALESFSP
jgi:hypothetical protein